MIETKLNLGCRIDFMPKDKGWINCDIVDFEWLKKMLQQKLKQDMNKSKLNKVHSLEELERMVRTDNVNYIPFNLLEFPYPFKEDQFELVVADGILEHFTGEQIPKIIKELHRVMKSNSKLIIKTPHYSNATGLTMMDHRNFFGVETFHFLYEVYEGFLGMFKPNLKVKLIWKHERYNRHLIKVIAKIGNWFLNLNPRRSERYFANYLGGFEGIEYEIEVLKTEN